MSNLLHYLKNIAVIFEKKKNPLFNYPLNRQRQYLDSFNEPKDDIERSFFQYKCQMHVYGGLLSIFWNIASFVLYTPLLLKYRKTNPSNLEEDFARAVFFDNGLPMNIVPSELYLEFGDIKKTGEVNRLRLSHTDMYFLNMVRKRYPLEWHYHLKLMIKVAQYRAIIDKCNPKVLIVSSEYSFTSSAMREICESLNIELINIQHGENFFYIGDAFFHFDRCYVWNESYADLFKSLRAEKEQFSIAMPRALKFDWQCKSPKKYDYTYYLSNESGKLLQTIHENLRELKNRGAIVCVRPHPRYSNMKEVEKVFIDVDIQCVNTVCIEESIMQTKNVVALFSAVLQQAYANSVDIIIDDISDLKRYEKLFELEYSLLKQEHRLLSEVISQ